MIVLVDFDKAENKSSSPSPSSSNIDFFEGFPVRSGFFFFPDSFDGLSFAFLIDENKSSSESSRTGKLDVAFGFSGVSYKQLRNISS